MNEEYVNDDYYINAVGHLRPRRNNIDTRWLDEYKNLKLRGLTNVVIAMHLNISLKALEMRLCRARQRGDQRAVYNLTLRGKQRPLLLEKGREKER